MRATLIAIDFLAYLCYNKRMRCFLTEATKKYRAKPYRNLGGGIMACFVKPNSSTKIALNSTIDKDSLNDFKRRYSKYGIDIDVDPWEEVVEMNSMNCDDEEVIK